MRKRVISITIWGLVLLLLPLIANATILDNGTCGDNITWSFSNDNILTVEGTGMIPNNTAPWTDYLSIAEEIIIRNGITRIGNSTFQNTPKVKNLSLPDTLIAIGSSNFNDCSSLITLSFPEGLEKIDYSCFIRCPSITEIYIPASLKEIGFFTFTHNASLTKFYVAESNMNYCSVDGVVFSKDMTILQCYPIGNLRTMYTVPDGVDTIQEDAFANSSYLSSVIFPNTLQRIHVNAFAWCSGITNIDLPATLTFMNSGVFIGTSISEIKLPESITYMGDSMFPQGTLIKCVKGSYADTWAQENGYSIEYYEHEHVPVIDIGYPATCTETGLTEGSHCSVCGEVFVAQEVIPFTHVLVKHDKVEPTYTSTGTEEYWKCSVCGKLFSDANGTNEISNPVVIPKLIPPSTKLSSIKAEKEKLTILWKAVKTINGYEIQYSLKKNFKGTKTVTINKPKATSTTIKKLQSGKTYYIRIRTFKKFKGKKYYSEWSKTLSKKVK